MMYMTKIKICFQSFLIVHMNNLVLKISEFIHINDAFSSVRQLEHVILKCPTISVLPLAYLENLFYNKKIYITLHSKNLSLICINSKIFKTRLFSYEQ